MEAEETRLTPVALRRRRRAVLRALEQVHRQIALLEKHVLRVERRQAVLAKRRQRWA